MIDPDILITLRRLALQASRGSWSDEEKFQRYCRPDVTLALLDEREQLRAENTRVHIELIRMIERDHETVTREVIDGALAVERAFTADAHRELEKIREENQRLTEENAAQSYKGNSVSHWWAKAHAYGGIAHGCSPTLAAAGHPVDASQEDGAVGGIARAVTALAAERDRLVAAVAGYATRTNESEERAAQLEDQNIRLARHILKNDLMPKGFEGGAVDCAIAIMGGGK